jgi:beta-lactamase regulating signal transducer with metallopeptidase domain/predicted  nucleic acid-binding Zn-ribbon protein
MILTVLVEAAARSLLLALAVGLVLWLTRARNARLQTMAWTLVLVGALLMPWLMRWRMIEIHAPRHLAATAPVVMRTVRESMVPVALPAARVTAVRKVNWRAIGLSVYAGVAAVLVLRVLTGLWLTFLLWRRSGRVREPWAAGLDIRETAAIGAPATFGSSILLPAKWRDWDELKRRAVVAHERAHVEWGDFYVQLLGRVHVAIFWFSPLGWWLEDRLIRLAEAASDDAALEAVAERSSYAEILLGLAGKLEQAQAAVAMARPATISRRVERVLSDTGLPTKAGWRRYAEVAAAVVCGVAIIAGCTTRAQTGIAMLQAQAPAAEAPAAPAEPSEKPASPAPPERPQAETRHTWWWQTGKQGDAYAIVSGDSLNMSGSNEDAKRARSFRSKISGEYIWFEHEGKQYLITDRAIVERAKELFRPQEELGRRQALLGERQARLGEAQALLGEKQAKASVKMPALDDRLRAVNAQMQEIEKRLRDGKLGELAEDRAKLLERLEEDLRRGTGAQFTQEQLAELQAKAAEVQARLSEDLESRLAETQNRMAEVQSVLGELQSRVGEQQSKLGEEQSLLGDQQSRLGEEQSKLGEEQSLLAERASRELRRIFEECLKNGMARAAQ